MDPKLLLVKILTLLYKESVSSDKSVRSEEIVRAALDSIKLPETGMDFGGTREALQALRATAQWMLTAPADHVYDKASLLQRVRINAGDDQSLYAAFSDGIAEVVDGDELRREISDTRIELRTAMAYDRYQQFVKKMYQKSFHGDSAINFKQLAREAINELEGFASSGQEDAVEGMLYSFSLSDRDKACELFEQAVDETSAAGILRMGWQGVNRMTGDHAGLRRGEFITVGALQHNYKTGFTLKMFKHAALYNKPHMRDPNKIPTLVHISTENDPHINMVLLYRDLMENETGQVCDMADFKHPDPATRKAAIARAAEYVEKRMTATGYKILMYRFNPSDTTFYSLTDLLDRLIAEGHEIHLVVCDYLNMCSKVGCLTMGPTGADIRDLFRRVRNYTAPRGITFVTPHQLSTEAKSLVRAGVDNFVGEIANKGYYDGCKTIDQEVDLEFYIHIEKHQGRSFLTIQRGKHRKGGAQTPDRDLYTILPFHDAGGLRDDVEGKDTSMRSFRGGTGSDAPWWDVSAANTPDAPQADSGLPMAA